MLTRYSCGHIGKITGRKVKAFIRVAEIRGHPVEDSPKSCPDCKHAEKES